MLADLRVLVVQVGAGLALRLVHVRVVVCVRVVAVVVHVRVVVVVVHVRVVAAEEVRDVLGGAVVEVAFRQVGACLPRLCPCLYHCLHHPYPYLCHHCHFLYHPDPCLCLCHHSHFLSHPDPCLCLCLSHHCHFLSHPYPYPCHHHLH